MEMGERKEVGLPRPLGRLALLRARRRASVRKRSFNMFTGSASERASELGIGDRECAPPATCALTAGAGAHKHGVLLDAAQPRGRA